MYIVIGIICGIVLVLGSKWVCREFKLSAVEYAACLVFGVGIGVVLAATGVI